MKIIENLYAYLWPGLTASELMTFGNNSNSYLIAGCIAGKNPAGHLLIDPGHIINETGTDCLQKLMDGMKKDGLKPEDVGMVIITHGHQDHCEASQRFQEKYHSLTAIGEKEEGILASRFPGLKPDLLLKEGTLKLHNLTLDVINTPGHSPGSISLYWKEKKVLITGDVIFSQNTGRVDISGGSGAVLKETIRKLSALEIEYLLTGHQYESPGIIRSARQIKENFDFVIKNVFPYL